MSLRKRPTYVIAALTLAALSVPTQAQPVRLFPGTGSEVADQVGGPGGPDNDGTVDIVNAINVPVPNTGGALEFSGDIIWNTTGSISGPGLLSTSITVTNATIINTTGSTVAMSAPVTLAERVHAGYPAFSWIGWPIEGPHAIGSVNVNGTLSTPFVSAPYINQNIAVSVNDDVWFPVSGTGPFNAPQASWPGAPPSILAQSVPMSATDSSDGDIATQPTTLSGGRVSLTLESLELGPNEQMFFPNSIHAVIEVVPEPASFALIGLASLALIRRR